MHSTPTPEEADPHAVRAPRADERVASDEQTVRQELARVHERPSSDAHDTSPASLDPQITAFRAAAINNGRGGGFGRSAVRGLIGLVLVTCVGTGAVIWQSSSGHVARRMIAQLAPQLISNFSNLSRPSSSQPSEKSEAASQPSSPPPAVQMAAAEAAAAQPTASAETAPQDAAPAAATLPTEQAQLLQTMARDLADAQQRIAELKTSQEQLARDNATTVEQLKAAQQQIARLTAAKTPEQNFRPKPVAPPPPRRPIAAMTAPIRQPVSALPPPAPQALPPPQAVAQPQAPAYPPQASAYPQTAPQPQGEQMQMSSAPRPPMPVPQ